MINLLILLFLALSTSVFAESKPRDKNAQNPLVFEIIPLNSPVKESTAKFSLKFPAGFVVDKIKVKLVNANDLKKDQKKFEDVKIAGNELNVGVSKLPPGFYRLHVKVTDKKSKKEHDYKTKYHDFVRFVIDESLQVPVPDPKKNNATVAGIDSDNDGIRDDIQRWINESYANRPNMKLAMKQYATAFQLKLLTIDNKEQNIQMTFQAFEAGECLYGLLGLDQQIEEEDKLIIKYLNTKARLVAKKKAGLNFHGQGGIIPDNKLTFCQFEVK